VAGQGSRHPEFIQSAVMSLRPGMSEGAVIELFGLPDRQDLSTCGANTPNPWPCKIWYFELPGDLWGRYQATTNTNVLYFNAGGLLNSWHTDLVYPDPEFTAVYSTKCQSESPSNSDADEAVACFIEGVTARNFGLIASIFGTKDGSILTRDERAPAMRRASIIQCVISTGNSAACMDPDTLSARPSAPLSFAIVRQDKATAVAFVRAADRRVFPITLVRASNKSWFVETIGLLSATGMR